MTEDLPDDDTSLKGTRDWPHAPPHRLGSAGVYFVTARTQNKQQLLHTAERRDWFQQTLFVLAEEFGWRLEAWAILSNHYHLIAHSPDGDAKTLPEFIRKLHSLTTRHLNKLDQTPSRTRLWHNYRETHLTLQKGYLARLSYVHQNAVIMA